MASICDDSQCFATPTAGYVVTCTWTGSGHTWQLTGPARPEQCWNRIDILNFGHHLSTSIRRSGRLRQWYAVKSNNKPSHVVMLNCHCQIIATWTLVTIIATLRWASCGPVPGPGLNYCIALTFDRHIGSSAAEVPVKFQERSDNSKYKFRGFETSWCLTLRRLMWYWNGVLVTTHSVSNRPQGKPVKICMFTKFRHLLWTTKYKWWDIHKSTLALV